MAMFEHETNREVQENRVVITDVDVEVFQELLRYIYVGMVSNMEQNADGLLAASDKVGKTVINVAQLAKHCRSGKRVPTVLLNY